MNENEEFEFRLRAEQEKSQQPLSQPQPNNTMRNVAMGAGAVAGFGALGYGVSKIPIYNDKMVTNTAKDMIKKVQGKIEPLRALYKSTLSPFAGQVVDSDTFESALNQVPQSIKKDFIDAYGSKVTDAVGRPSTTVGNLHKMELELKDFIQQPKFADKISAADYNIAESAKTLKQIRMSQLPQETNEVIKTLDGQFGQAIKISDELMPKLTDKNGKINTKFLFNAFKNPADAGTRDYLKSLKGLGVDLTKETKVIEGWVKRQALKDSFKSIPLAGNLLKMTGKLAVGLPAAVIGGEMQKRGAGYDPAEAFHIWYTSKFGKEAEKKVMDEKYQSAYQKAMAI